MVVQTGSMEPHISPGDAAVIAPWDMMDLVPVGGVVQFRSPAAAEPDGVERLRLHRIVETNDDGTFVTAGDANRDVDSSPLRRDQIAGQARVLVPFIGLPGFWLGTGQFAKLAAWAGLTLLALMLVIGGPARWPPQAMQLEQDAEPARQQVDRRAVLALAALAAAGGMVGTRLQPSAASFTTSTGTKASWSVASLPKLTLGGRRPMSCWPTTPLSTRHFWGSARRLPAMWPRVRVPRSSISGLGILTAARTAIPPEPAMPRVTCLPCMRRWRSTRPPNRAAPPCRGR